MKNLNESIGRNHLYEKPVLRPGGVDSSRRTRRGVKSTLDHSAITNENSGVCTRITTKPGSLYFVSSSSRKAGSQSCYRCSPEIDQHNFPRSGLRFKGWELSHAMDSRTSQAGTFIYWQAWAEMQAVGFACVEGSKCLCNRKSRLVSFDTHGTGGRFSRAVDIYRQEVIERDGFPSWRVEGVVSVHAVPFFWANQT